MSRRTTRLALTTAGAALASAALVAVPAPAFAQPLPEPDRYGMYAGGTYTVEPLDNDDTSFLSTGALSVCGISGVDTGKLYVVRRDDALVVEVRDAIQGTTQFTYDACQGNQRASSTITVGIGLLRDVKGVKKKSTRGKVVFTNPNSVEVQVSYGSASSGRPDATRTVPAGRSITVGTRRTSLYWLALHSHGGVVINVGDDTIYRVQRRRG